MREAPIDHSQWRDLTDPRRADVQHDLELGLKAPKFENLEIPERFGPIQVRIDDHKIKRFAFTHDDYNPWYFGASPFGRRIGPAALLANDLLQLFTTRYAPSQVVGLHTEEQLWFNSPAYLDEDVTLSGEYTEAYERRGHGYVVMNAQARGADGRIIIRHRGVEILRTQPGEVAGRATSAAGAQERRVTGVVPHNARLIADINDDIRLESVLAPISKVVTQEQASVFSRTGEYIRNIHNDLDVARAAGLLMPIVQGQQQVGIVSELMTRTFGADWYTGGWMRVKFLQPVPVFQLVTASGLVTEIEPLDNGTARVNLDVWIRRADSQLSAVGWASCTLPDISPRLSSLS